MPQERITVYVGTCLTVGTATIETDPVHREMLCIRLAALPVDGVICLPLADLLVVAGDARLAAATTSLPVAEKVAGHA